MGNVTDVSGNLLDEAWFVIESVSTVTPEKGS
jgi:hypothetical protein